MAGYGEGYRSHVTGLTHDPMGFLTNKATEIQVKMDKLRNKITDYTSEITKLRIESMDDAEVAFISYGSVSRTVLQASSIARKAGARVGSIQLCTIWPFPDAEIRKLCKLCKAVVVAELNMGQIIHEVERVLPKDIEVVPLQRYDGEILTPMQLLEKLEEVL